MLNISQFTSIESWIDYTLKISDPRYPRHKPSLWDGGSYHGDLPLGESWGYVMSYAPNVAETLDESNWQCLIADLDKRYENSDQDEYAIEGVSHYITRLEYLYVRLLDDSGNPTDIAQFIYDVLRKLDDYLVYNEDHYYELEYEYNSELMADIARSMVNLVSPDYWFEESDIINWMATSHYRTAQHRAYDRVISEGSWLDRDEQSELLNLYIWDQYGFMGI